jgi:hypothetical protein
MAVLPATGTQIQMSRIGSALGLYTSGSIPTASVGLNQTLGTNRYRIAGQSAIAFSGQTGESLSFGGLNAPGTY